MDRDDVQLRRAVKMDGTWRTATSVLVAMLLVAAPLARGFAKQPEATGIVLSGIWKSQPPMEWVNPAKDEIPLTPEYARKLKKWREAVDRGQPPPDSVARCEAFGMPRVMSFAQFELLETPGQVTIITEILHEVRRIYTDGRKPPADLDLTYGGYSTGHWEGKTLVVETVGLMASTLDQYGIPHSDELKVLERLELIDKDTMRNRITLIDSLAYTKPWTVERKYKRLHDFELQEYICNTNGAAIEGETIQ